LVLLINTQREHAKKVTTLECRSFAVFRGLDNPLCTQRMLRSGHCGGFISAHFLI
jgi:hypothetical protein